MPSFISVIRTSMRSLPVAASRSFIRSWVSGRGGTTPCCANAIAVASGAPIQIGRYRSPATSRSSTMGWLEGISTRTPMTSTSRTRSAYSRSERTRRQEFSGPQRGLHETGVQPHGERGDRGDGLLGPSGGAGVPASAQRGHYLLDDAHLTVSSRLHGAQVPWLEPEGGQLPRRLRDHQRVAVVRRGTRPGPRSHQTVGFELVEQGLLDLGGGQQFRPRESQLRGVSRERVRGRVAVAGQDHARHLRARGAVQRRRLQAAVDRVEVLADHLQREVVLTLAGQHVPQPLHVTVRELPVAGWGALRFDQPLGLEEPDLGDVQAGEVRTQLAEHLPDAQPSPRGGRLSHGSAAWLALAGEVDQAVLADLHLVAALQRHLVDPVPVDVGAVETPYVGDGEPLRRTAELGVPAGDRHVVEEDLAVRVTPRRNHVGVEEEPAAGARAALHDQQCAAHRERVHRGRVGLVQPVVTVVGFLRGGAERDRRGGLAGGFLPTPGPTGGPSRRAAGRLGGLLQAMPALGTEARPLLVLVSALGAERHHRPPKSIRTAAGSTLNQQSRFTVAGPEPNSATLAFKRVQQT